MTHWGDSEVSAHLFPTSFPTAEDGFVEEHQKVGVLISRFLIYQAKEAE